METPRDSEKHGLGPAPAPGSSLTESSIRLFDRARGGDSRALDHLYQRYLPRLSRWAAGRLPRYARGLLETDDLVQEVLIRSIRNVPSFEVREGVGFYGYLRRGLTNRIRDEIRRAQRTPEMGELSGDELARTPSPLEEAIGREQVQRYENALEQLKPIEREAIIARIEMGCSYQEVAEAIGKPSPDAARMTVARALLRLAEEMSRNA